MAKQNKAKSAAAKGSNPDRPNGKAWKKMHRDNPPVAQAKADHERNKERERQLATNRRRQD